MQKTLAVALLLALVCHARADVRVGIIVSATGPAAALGGPQQKVVTLLPKTIAGEPVVYVLLDDESDPTVAVKDAQKLIAAESVDVILGPSITPNAIAITGAAAEAGVPLVTMASSASITTPPDGNRRWIFKVPQGDDVQAEATILRMKKDGIKTIGFIGFSDSYGENYAKQAQKSARDHGLTIVADERYAKTDMSVTAQALRLMASKPDGIFIVAAGAPAVLPEAALRERGYAGPIYQTNGVASEDFIRLGGKNVEGTLIAVTPMLVAEQLPDSNPSKVPALEFLHAYESRYGANTRSNFAALMWDASKILEHALPDALKTSRPGSQNFRSALRDAIERTTNLSLNSGTFTYTPKDHSGLDASAMVFVRVEKSSWKLAE